MSTNLETNVTELWLTAPRKFFDRLSNVDKDIVGADFEALLPAIEDASLTVQSSWKDAIPRGWYMTKASFGVRMKEAAARKALQAAEDAAEGPPTYFPGDHPVPGSPGFRYTPGVGVWRAKVKVLDWCPKVIRHLGVIRRNGEVTRRTVTVEVGEQAPTVLISEVADGKLWRERFTTARGTATREVREALVNIVEDQAAALPMIPALAYWTAEGHLVLPPLDTLSGYGDTRGTLADFEVLLRVAAGAPRVALMMGTAIGGLYIEPTAAQSHVVHIAGAGRQGKSTSLFAAAATLGYAGEAAKQPGGVIRSWNTTALGPLTSLHGLGCLPACRDDLSAANFKPDIRSKLVFGITQGSERDASTRSGQHRDSPGEWHGAMLSSGNFQFTAGITNEGLLARVLEVGAPMTPTPELADEIEAAASAGYGHGLHAVVDRGWTPDRFKAEHRKVSAELGVTRGAVKGTLGLYVSLHVTGARLLAELFEVPAFAEAALSAAKDVLEEVSVGLSDRGDSAAMRLLEAIMEDMTSRAGLYPTRAAAAAHRPWPGDRAETVGWDLAGDDEPGDVAVLPRELREIAKRHDIEDANVALAELDASGRLHRRDDRKHRTRLLWVGDRPRCCYVLCLPSREADSDAKTTDPGQASPVPEKGPADDGTRPTTEPMDADVAADANVGTAVATAVGDACSACSVVGPSCGFGATAEHASPCVLCQNPTQVRSWCGAPRHANCHPGGVATSDEESLEKTAGPPRRQTEPNSGPRTADAPAREVVDPGVELANVTRPIRERWPNAADTDITAALTAWHGATDGLRFVSYPGEVGVAALHRLVAANHSMSLPVPLDAGGPVEEIIESGDLLRYAEWITPRVEVDGRSVTSLDVNAQYLAAARSVELGDGQPVRYDKPRGGLVELSKLPGYVLLGKKLVTKHPAFRTIRGGTWLAMPTVAYLLRDCGVELDAASVVVWHDHGRRLSAWAARFSDALAALPAGRDLSTTYARGLVKDVYVSYLGGMLRSERWNKLPRPDWSDQVVTQAEANKLRALDKATAAGETVLGSWRDAAWFVADDAPHEPGGLTISTQPGKWKVDRYSQVTPELAQAYTSGSPVVFRDALNAANAERKAGGVL